MCIGYFYIFMTLSLHGVLIKGHIPASSTPSAVLSLRIINTPSSILGKH